MAAALPSAQLGRNAVKVSRLGLGTAYGAGLLREDAPTPAAVGSQQ